MHAPFDCSRLIYATIFARYPKRLRSIQSNFALAYVSILFPFSFYFFSIYPSYIFRLVSLPNGKA